MEEARHRRGMETAWYMRISLKNSTWQFKPSINENIHHPCLHCDWNTWSMSSSSQRTQASQTARAMWPTKWVCRVGNDKISVPVAKPSTILGRRHERLRNTDFSMLSLCFSGPQQSNAGTLKFPGAYSFIFSSFKYKNCFSSITNTSWHILTSQQTWNSPCPHNITTICRNLPTSSTWPLSYAVVSKFCGLEHVSWPDNTNWIL
jgi:hypothetical protein